MALASAQESSASADYEQLDEAQQAATLLRFAKRGQPMKAFHAIQSLGLAPNNDSTRHTVHKLLGSTLPRSETKPLTTTAGRWRAR
eukprot:459541-Amphidinium_carterae.1